MSTRVGQIRIYKFNWFICTGSCIQYHVRYRGLLLSEHISWTDERKRLGVHTKSELHNSWAENKA